MNWNNYKIVLYDTHIVKNTNLVLHMLSVDRKEKGYENSLALKELGDKQQNQMEKPDNSKVSIREEGDKDKEEALNLQQRNILGVHRGKQAAAMNNSYEEDDDNEDSSSSESEEEVSVFGSLLCV